MRQKTMRVVVTFFTTAEAMATERLCGRENIPGRLIPAPRSISADCGIAWSSPAEEESRLRAAIAAAGLEVQGCSRMML